MSTGLSAIVTMRSLWRPVLAMALAVIMLAPQAHATTLGLQDKSYAKSALAYADKGQWDKALAQADKSSHTGVRALLQWLYVKSPSSKADFTSIRTFLEKEQNWPSQSSIRQRAESSLSGSHPDIDILSWFNDHPPTTYRGKRILAEALIARAGSENNAPPPPEALSLLKEIWRSGSMGKGEQSEFLSRYSKHLTRDDHIARVDNLMWEQRITQSQPLLNKVGAEYRTLFDARAKLIRNKPGVSSAINKVPQHLQMNPGLIYERMQWRQKRKLHDGVRELLSICPEKVPHPEKWWKARHYQIRELIDERQYSKALAFAQNHGQEDGLERVEAEWLAGWISLEFTKEPETAYKHFFRLYHTANYPISKSRGAYWAGVAARRNGNHDVADGWFKVAAEYSAAFYGQLAMLELDPNAKLELPNIERIDRNAYNRFLKRDPVQGILIFAEVDRIDSAKHLLLAMVQTAESDEERAMLTKLGYDLRRTDFAVKAAKTAMRFGTVLPDAGYPVMRFSPMRKIELPYVMAITRQESEFRVDAQSHAGAVGLMQLLPTTARQVSRHLNLRYSKHKLRTSSSYNLQVGAGYLSELTDRYDGSYLLATAAYNAGPGRVSKWIEKYGDPRDAKVDPLLWMERLPYNETRNYIQRVLENLQIYRYRMQDEQRGNREPLPLKLANDIHLFIDGAPEAGRGWNAAAYTP